MTPIKITKKLSVNPDKIDLPLPGTAKLEFVASGPGQVEIQYSINPRKSIRFFDGDEPKARLLDEEVLSTEPKKIVKDILFCLINEENSYEPFIITVTVRKKAPDGTITDYTSSRRGCSYYIH